MQLLQPLLFERNPHGATLVLWLCEPSDQQYSFREALDEVIDALQAGNAVSTSVELPLEQLAEDFVQGKLTWNGQRFGLYYERSLGYMQFSSASAPALEALQTAIEAGLSFQQAPDGGAQIKQHASPTSINSHFRREGKLVLVASLLVFAIGILAAMVVPATLNWFASTFARAAP